MDGNKEQRPDPLVSEKTTEAAANLATVTVSDVMQVIEADRLSNDSPMFNDPSPQAQDIDLHDILASSSSSEDAFRSLEKLENLARLAENAALEDRDVDTPQSFVTAEEENAEEITERHGEDKENESRGDKAIPGSDNEPKINTPNATDSAETGTSVVLRLVNKQKPKKTSLVCAVLWQWYCVGMLPTCLYTVAS